MISKKLRVPVLSRNSQIREDNFELNVTKEQYSQGAGYQILWPYEKLDTQFSALRKFPVKLYYLFTEIVKYNSFTISNPFYFHVIAYNLSNTK